MLNLFKFESRNSDSLFEQFPLIVCLFTIFERCFLMTRISWFASSWVSWLYTFFSYSCLLHSSMTSVLSAQAGPTFLSVSLMTTLTFLLRCNFLKAVFSWLDIFCDLFIPIVFWNTSSSLSRTLKQNVLTFLYSSMQFQELLIRKDLSRTKVPEVFSTKKNILLFILRLKSSKLENTLFHFKDSVLGMNFIPSDSTLTVAKFGLAKTFWKIVYSRRNHLIFKNVHRRKSGEYGSTSPWGLKVDLLKLDGPCLLKKLLLLAVLISFIHRSSFVVNSFVWLLLHFFCHLFSLCIRFSKM